MNEIKRKREDDENRNKYIEKRCPICLENMDNPDKYYFLNCMHKYHEECINEWLRRNLFCPICRIPIFIDSPMLLDEFNNFYKLEKSNEENIRNNIPIDLNSISYRFMEQKNIENIYGYNPLEEMRSRYNRLLDNNEEGEESRSNEIIRGRIIPSPLSLQTRNNIVRNRNHASLLREILNIMRERQHPNSPTSSDEDLETQYSEEIMQEGGRTRLEILGNGNRIRTITREETPNSNMVFELTNYLLSPNNTQLEGNRREGEHREEKEQKEEQKEEYQREIRTPEIIRNYTFDILSGSFLNEPRTIRGNNRIVSNIHFNSFQNLSSNQNENTELINQNDTHEGINQNRIIDGENEETNEILQFLQSMNSMFQTNINQNQTNINTINNIQESLFQRTEIVENINQESQNQTNQSQENELFENQNIDNNTQENNNLNDCCYYCF